MSDQASRLSQRFLEMLDTTSGKEILDTLNELMITLENKNDPDMTEVCLVGNLTEFADKLQIMRHNLKSYSEGKKTLLGDKLSELYDDNTHEGIFSQK